TRTWLYDPRILGGPGAPELRLVWWVTIGVAGRGTDLASVFVDADDGQVVLAFSELKTSKQRQVCDLANQSGLNIEGDINSYVCSDAPGGPPVVRREAQ